jgi:hypothetical protein
MAAAPSTPSTEVELPTESASSEDTETTEISEDPRNIPVIEDEGAKVCYIVDLNLFSGSNDIFRTNVGGYFFNTINTSGNVVLSFSSFYKDLEPEHADETRPLNQYLESMTSYRSEENVNIDTDARANRENKVIPNFQFVVAVDGKPDHVINDKFWKTLWIGGTYNGVEYEPIYTNNITFDDFYTAYIHPYSAIAKEYLTNPAAISNYMSISYKYNSHLRRYQGWSSRRRQERQIPNVHLNTWAYLYLGGQSAYAPPPTSPMDPTATPPALPSNIENFVTRDGSIENIEGLLMANKYIEDDDNPDLSYYSGEVNLDFLKYLNKKIPSGSIGQQTRQWANRSFKNILFNDDYFSTVYPEVLVHAPMYPLYTKIECVTETQGFIGSTIAAKKYSTRFLRLLKEIFLGRPPRGVKVRNSQFEKNTKYLTSAPGQPSNIPVSTSERVELKGVEIFDFLIHSYDRLRNRADNFLIIDEPNIETAAAYDKTGAYRHLNTTNTLEVLNTIVEELNAPYNQIRNIRSLLNVQKWTPVDGVDRSNVPEPKYTEVVAYRIEKLRAGTGPAAKRRVIQNFWFFNSRDLNELEFYDTQVKYGEEYTYNVYEYRLIQGLKYKYSNLQLSKVIGMPNAEQEAMDGDEDYVPAYYCVEYYNPYDDTVRNDLLKEEVYTFDAGTHSVDPGGISAIADDAQRIATSRSPGSSKKPYFANFLVTVEPNLKLFEVPIMQKSLRVLDNPPNKLNVFPKYTDGDKNTLLFELHYEGYSNKKYPVTVDTGDANVKEQYLNANDLLQDSILQKETVSRQSRVEIYRTSKRPTSFRSFAGNLWDTQELIMDITKNTYTSACIYDIVPSNTKFYYAFRVVNENGIAGYMEEIIEAEYINDGGYRYAMFNTLYEDELVEDVFSKITTNAQKIIQIEPNVQQTALNTEDADFESDAEIELLSGRVKVGTAEDLIWEKTFKIRLTSKKTGKKIDLNVTYKENNDILESE